MIIGRIDSDENFGVSLSHMIGIIMFPFYYALLLLFNNLIILLSLIECIWKKFWSILASNCLNENPSGKVSTSNPSKIRICLRDASLFSHYFLLR